MLYTERLRQEQAALRRQPRSLRARLLHSGRRCSRRALHQPEDPDSRWKCCPRWHRKLANKWNSRAFAVRHGCRVPELYWSGADVERLPFSELPDAYVIRPMWGTAHAQGTCAMWKGRNLMTGRDTTPIELREELLGTTSPAAREGRRRERIPLLVEEFITDREGDGALPIDYKCFTFGENVAAILAVRRISRDVAAQQGAFLPDWTPLEGGIAAEEKPPLSPAVPRPECMDELLACAGRLGRAVGRHVRVDFYATPAGPVFGEMTFWSHGAQGFNAFAEKYLAEQWERAYPSAPRTS